MLRKSFIGALLFVICLLPLGLVTSVPRTNRHYIAPQELLPSVQQLGRQVVVRQVRSFRYGADSSMTPGYYDRTYDLNQVRRVWFGVTPFEDWRGPAHVFLSFEFADSQYLAVSVEARREVGEEFSAWRGLWRGYELMYVIADEADVIGVRALVDRDPVYLYPGRANPAQAAFLLEVLLARARELHSSPEYYHTLFNNCATNLAAAVNRVSPGKVPWSRALVLPGFSDDYAYRLGLLALAGPPAEVRERYRVDERARAANGSLAFSAYIRQGMAVR